MLTVGSFTLRHSKLSQASCLPLERIEMVEGDSYFISNRYGLKSSTHKRSLIELDLQNEKYLWDELVQLEKKILFFQECLESPENFSYIQAIGYVKKIEAKNEAIPQTAPWTSVKISSQVLLPLTDARLLQVQNLLIEREDEHEFLVEAIESLG
jgi:hypothetical protein